MARPRSDISERLVKAARARFLTEGVDGASLRDIAKDAGTSVGMLSYYFPSKDELFLAVLKHVYPRLMSQMRVALEGEGTVQERIGRAYQRLHALDDEEFAVVRILVREALVSSKRLQKLVKRFTSHGAHVPLLLQTFGQAIAGGEVRDDLPPLAPVVATMALGLAPVIVRRLATAAGLDEALPPPEEIARMMSGVLFEGIGAKQGPARKPRRAQVKRSLR